MYLLEAKRRAEKEEKREREKERKKEKMKAKEDQQARALLSRSKQSEDHEQEMKRREQEMLEEAMRQSKLTAAREAVAREPPRVRTASELPRAAREPQVKRAPQVRQVSAAPRSASAAAATSSHPPPKPAGVGPSAPRIVSAPLKTSLVPERENSDDEWRDVRVKCQYVGTFETGSGKIDRDAVKRGLTIMNQHVASARPCVLLLSLEGIKVIDTTSDQVAMAHALARVSISSIDASLCLFGFVAKNPGSPNKFCHVFKMSQSKHVENAQALVSKAFRLAFTKDRSVRRSSQAAPGMAGRPQPAQTSSPNQERRWAKQNPLKGLRDTTAAQDVAPALAARKPQEPSTKPSKRPDAYEVSIPHEYENIDDGFGDCFLENAPWYQSGIPRDIAEELLALSDEGAFIVRDSQSQPGSYALTLKLRDRTCNFIIKNTAEGYIIGTDADGERPYASLPELILSHAERRGVLPIELELNMDNKLFDEDNDDNDGSGAGNRDSYIAPEYQAILSWDQMMGMTP